MNPQIQSEKTFETTEIEATDAETLKQSGFTSEEIIALLWLRQWYQNGGSDRIEVVRRLEFLKLLVTSGKIEL